MTVAEVEWTRSLVDELSSGTFPMLDVWRQWRETGAISTELGELAQRGAEHDEEQA
jgi:hypothetical protein